MNGWATNIEGTQRVLEDTSTRIEELAGMFALLTEKIVEPVIEAGGLTGAVGHATAGFFDDQVRHRLTPAFQQCGAALNATSEVLHAVNSADEQMMEQLSAGVAQSFATDDSTFTATRRLGGIHAGSTPR